MYPPGFAVRNVPGTRSEARRSERSVTFVTLGRSRACPTALRGFPGRGRARAHTHCTTGGTQRFVSKVRVRLKQPHLIAPCKHRCGLARGAAPQARRSGGATTHSIDTPDYLSRTRRAHALGTKIPSRNITYKAIIRIHIIARPTCRTCV